MSKAIKVYVAGPLTGNPNKNVHNAMTVTDNLMQMGFIPFCPHLLYFQNAVYWRSYEFWLDYDMEWLKVCDAVFRMPGDSPGSDKEVELAKSLNIPVYYSFEELQKAYGTSA